MFFNRPGPLGRVMEALRASKPPVVFLVQDGPRPHHPDDAALVGEARAVAENIDWDATVHRIYSDTNLGVRGRFLTALDEVFSAVDRAIILEDDCEPDGSFFPFCDELLERYEPDERVGMISGNNFLRGHRVTGDSYFFTPDVRIWGWATWSRVWREVSETESQRTWSESQYREAISRLDSPQRRSAMARMARIIDGLDTWDVSFVLHCLDRGYLNITPEVNLVRNIGFGADSTHTAFHSFADDIPTGSLPFPLRHPETVASTPEAGIVEAREHRRLWRTFPLHHPVEFTRRALSYLRQVVSRRS